MATVNKQSTTKTATKAATPTDSTLSSKKGPPVHLATPREESVVEKTMDEVRSNDCGSVDEQCCPVKVFGGKMNKYIASLMAMKKDLNDLIMVGKSLEKEFASTAKQLQKKSKTKTGGERRHPSGFAVASLLSDEMYGFLDITKGEKVPRKDVTRMINDYITKNGLRDSADKRIIKPNSNLHKIFNSSDEDKITYFNLQSFIKHHFIKETAPVV